MLPILFSIGPIKLYTYSIFLFFAFFLGLFVIWKRGIELRFDEEPLFNSVFTIMLWMLVFSRIAYVLTYFDQFGFSFLAWLNVFTQPGFIGVGAFLGFFVGTYIEAIKQKWDVYLLGDALVPGLTLAQIILACGSFLNGSWLGTPTSLPWGVQFPGTFDARHPVQIYAAILYIGLFCLIWWLEGVYRTFAWYKGGKSQANSGFVLTVFIALMGVIHTILSFFSSTQFAIKGFSIDLFIYITVAFVGSLLLIYRSGGKSARSNGLEKMWKQLVKSNK